MSTQENCSEIRSLIMMQHEWIKSLEKKESRNAENVSELKEIVAVLANETKHLTTRLEQSNKNTAKIAEALSKVRLVLYAIVILVSVTIAPELGEAIPLLLKLAG